MQVQKEPPKEKIAAGTSYRGYREADTRAGAEENQVKEQMGATRKLQAVVRKAPVPQTTHRERRKDGTSDVQDQPHPAPHLPTHTAQIGAPSPPTAEPNGADTPTPQKVVDWVFLQARGDAKRGAEGTVPLDLSCSGKEDAPDRETTGMEDPSRKDSWLELTAPRERGDRRAPRREARRKGESQGRHLQGVPAPPRARNDEEGGNKEEAGSKGEKEHLIPKEASLTEIGNPRMSRMFAFIIYLTVLHALYCSVNNVSVLPTWNLSGVGILATLCFQTSPDSH